MSYTFIDMTDYTNRAIEQFEELYKINVIEAPTPMSEDIRTTGMEVPTVPQRAEQTMVGTILWIARCSRYDVYLATIALAGRLASWNDACGKQLLRLMGYLKATASHGLLMYAHEGGGARGPAHMR